MKAIKWMTAAGLMLAILGGVVVAQGVTRPSDAAVITQPTSWRIESAGSRWW